MGLGVWRFRGLPRAAKYPPHTNIQAANYVISLERTKAVVGQLVGFHLSLALSVRLSFEARGVQLRWGCSTERSL